MDSCLHHCVDELDALGAIGTGSIWDDLKKINLSQSQASGLDPTID
jgi:hypothetical protein